VVTSESNVDYQSIIEAIVDKTQNDIILAMIVICIAAALVGIPIYVLRIKENRIRTEKESTDKELLVSVVQSNTAAVSALKASVDLNNATVVEAIQNIHKNTDATNDNVCVILDKQEDHSDKLDSIHELTKDVSHKVDKLTDNVSELVQRNKNTD
jgi:predicted transcriptional regulator